MHSSRRVLLATGMSVVGSVLAVAPGLASAGTVSYARTVDGSPACVSITFRGGDPRSAEFVIPRGGGASDWATSRLVRRSLSGQRWWVSTDPAGRFGFRVNKAKAHMFWNGKPARDVILPRIPRTRVEEKCPSP